MSRVRGKFERPVIPTCGAHHPGDYKVRCQRPVKHSGPHCRYEKAALAEVEHTWS